MEQVSCSTPQIWKWSCIIAYGMQVAGKPEVWSMKTVQ
jgi:hypothetical protein